MGPVPMEHASCCDWLCASAGGPFPCAGRPSTPAAIASVIGMSLPRSPAYSPGIPRQALSAPVPRDRHPPGRPTARSRPASTPARGLPVPFWSPVQPPEALPAAAPAVSANPVAQPPSPPVSRPPVAALRLPYLPGLPPPSRGLGRHTFSAPAPPPGGPVAQGTARASRPFSRRCRRILSITAGSWINAITRISPPQRGHVSGSTS